MTNDLQMRGNLSKSLLQIAAQFSDAPSAIYEYVSNSIEYRDGPDGLRVMVLIEKNKIEISDNSMGMDNEILKNFFTLSGENLARQGKQKSWLKRGMYGTGKIAAFGIANSLTVETCKDGLKNIYRLTRDLIESTADDSNAIPLEKITDDEATQEPDGTKILIEDLNIKINSQDVIRKIEREISNFRGLDIQISVNSYVCEIKPLDIIQEYIFPLNGAVKDRYGDCYLTVQVSRSPLDEFDRGISIMSNKNRIGLEDCGISKKECGNLISGFIDIPDIESPIDNVTSFNQTRNMKLNPSHKGVKELIIFMGPKLEEVRKEILQKRDSERNSLQSKKLTQITDELSIKFNDQWNKLKKQLDEIRVGANGRNVNSLFYEIGDDDDLSAIGSGEDFDVEFSHDIRIGDTLNKTSPEDEPQKDLIESDESSHQGAKQPGKISKRRRSGFLVDHDSLGEDEHRSIYVKDDLKIIINTDHPTVKACMRSCNNDVENITFKRLVFEIAFREFEHAIGQEMIVDNDNYPPRDLLYEMRSNYDKISRVIGQDLYNF